MSDIEIIIDGVKMIVTEGDNWFEVKPVIDVSDLKFYKFTAFKGEPIEDIIKSLRNIAKTVNDLK